MPTYLACFVINLLLSSSSSCITYILVSGVDNTVWTHNCPLSVRCYFGGKIYPNISYV